MQNPGPGRYWSEQLPDFVGKVSPVLAPPSAAFGRSLGCSWDFWAQGTVHVQEYTRLDVTEKGSAVCIDFRGSQLLKS